MANELRNIHKKIIQAVKSEKNRRVALVSVLAIHKSRIFQQGEDSNQSKIGTYSTKPISISKSRQARNTGKTRFEGGYAEYKSAIGKNPGYKNYRNTDQMMMDYGLQSNGSEFGFGFQNPENYKKSQFLQEADEKDVFDLSEKELDVFANIYTDLISRDI